MFKGIYSEVAKEVGKSSAILLNQLLQWKTTKVFRTNAEMFEDLDGVLSIATIQRCKQKLIDFGYVIVSFDKGLNRVTHYTLTEKALSLLTKPLSLLSKRVSKNNTKAEVSLKKDTSAFSYLKESGSINQEQSDDTSELTIVENTTKLDDSANVERPSSSLRFEDEELITQEQNELKQRENKASGEWIPKHLYAQHMKEKRILAQQNKEFFIPKSMRESFEKAGEIRREVVKGVPKDLLSDPRLSKMLKSKQRNL